MPRGIYTRAKITVVCENSICRLPFTARKGGTPRRFCSDACRQAAYRVRRWKAAQEAKTA